MVIAMTLQTRYCASFFLVTALAWGPADAQTAKSSPSFYAASIRPLSSGDRSFSPLRIGPGGSVRGKATVEALIRLAYGIESYERVVFLKEVSDLRQRRFEITTALAPGSAPATREETLLMIQHLLSARFALRVRPDAELRSVSMLRLEQKDTLGPGLRRFTEACTPVPPNARLADPRFEDAYRNNCGLTIEGSRVRGTDTLYAFARLFSFIAKRPIIDGTGLAGRFQFDMSFDMETLVSGLGSSDAPAFVDAVRRQLGLRMDADQQPVRVLVVEHIGELVEN